MNLRWSQIRIIRIRAALVRIVLAGVIANGAHLGAQTPNIASLRKQAKDGDAEAQYQLANAYLSGSGVSKDLKQGVEWLQKAAKQEHAAAQTALWVMYREGFPPEIPKDPKQGLKWLQKSAEHGYATAEYNLGLLYENGNVATGIALNSHEAAAWFRKAARQPSSGMSRGELEKMLKKRLISEPEANWRPPFSLGEVESGLKGWITNKRMARLVQEFGVDFKMNPVTQKRLASDGADDNLLQTISASRRSL
jgi:hypothetical protein